LAVLCSPLWCAVSSSAQQSQGSTENSEVKHDESPRLTDIPGIPPQAGPNHEMRRHQPRQIKAGPSQADPAIQTVITTFAAPTAGINFDGVGNGVYGYTVNSAPPDTNGAVGPNHYVQWVNTSFAVFNKSGGLVWGPFNGNTLWSGFGGGCQANNDGDPIVQYDKIADRWIFMQFSVTAPYPYTVCMAVSTTPDPTGSYYRYEFSGFGTEFPDYPKLAVWPDGYYATYNLFNNGVIFTGPRFCSYDRSKMLTGAVATQQCFTLGSQFGGDLPSDIDGKTLPPAGSPDYILEFGTNALNLWKFHVDWTTPANTTLTGPTSIPVAAFSAACNGGGTCIPQGGTTQQLDSLADRVMYRLAYRNFGDHEALVVNHSVTAGSSVGVRWYEIRSPGGTPTVFQQGTYAPDAGYRWMGSIAMDRAGDIGLGYSISSSTTHPGIRYTGRLVTDALNTLQAEASIIDGAGSQTGGLSRWGDYSSITVDPVDDCTFWYTSEYIPANGSFNWRTRIASFKFASCGTPDYAVAASPASQSVVQGSGTSYTVTVTPSGGFTSTVGFSVSGLPAGAAATFNPASVAGSGSSTMAVTTNSTTPTGSYPLTITGTSGTLTHTALVTLVVTAPVAPDFSLSASPASQTVTQGSGTSYTATVTPSGGFTGTVTFSASGLPTGAAATFNPASVAGSGSSTMSVTTSSTTPTGSYALTITGTSGTLTHNTLVTLVVNPPPNFALSASPASQSVVQGASTSYTVTVTPSGGFTGTVSFSPSGLPTGASATFNPASVAGSGSSTMSVTTSSTTPTGSYPLTITGTSGTLSHTASVTLIVTAAATPNFTLSASPSSQTVTQGASTSYTVTITPSGGFTGSVTFSASGLPAGAAASFAPNPATSTSSMTVTTATTTPAGSYPLTITGVSGTLSHTASVTLVVTAAGAGNFSLSATPASQSIPAGASTTYTINVTRTGGFTGGVTLSATGVPAGATATFSPNPATGASSTLTVATSGTTPVNTFTITVTGTSGTLSHTTTVSLTVTAAPCTGECDN
jgi:uncharacterized membrane protein